MIARQFFTASTAAAAALALTLGLAAAPALADHKPNHNPGGGDSGQVTDLIADIPDVLADGTDSSLQHDGNREYDAQTGGDVQPNPPGIVVLLKDSGKPSRQRMITVVGDCDDQTIVGGDCSLLPEGEVLNVERAGLNLAVRPYEVNCPNPECPDTHTMGTEDAELMSFRVAFYEQITLELASAIGGAGSADPGRCLSLLTPEEQSDFRDVFCASADNCNVTVQASDRDGDGTNDAWSVSADDATALICSHLKNNVAFIGVVDGVSFTIDAEAQ